MNAVLIILVILGVFLQQATKKSYCKLVDGGAFSFPAASTLFALLVFIFTGSGNFEFVSGILPYALIFAISYSVGGVFIVLALGCGPLSLTSLMLSYSLIIPTLYGMLCLGEPVSVTLVLGIILLLISLVFVNFEKKTEKKQITVKWVLYTLLAFIGNGGCTTAQKVQQIDFAGKYKSETMIIALAVSLLIMSVVAVIYEKKTVFYNLKKGFWLYSSCGVANGVVNYFTILLATRMAASLLFPLVSAGGIIVSCVASVWFYKEKLSWMQVVGIVLGTLAIIAMNI